jgi:uncharacterized membrane protein (DUF373 family)
VPEPSRHPSRLAVASDGVMEVVEGVLYALVALLLVCSALVALGAVGYDLVDGVGDGALEAASTALDGLLLVFILIELLGAVRATVAERQLVAEPFLIVGMIASIKEIVVASLKAGSLEGEALQDAMLEIGVLGAVVLLLALASYLVRRKEREPTEG